MRDHLFRGWILGMWTILGAQLVRGGWNQELWWALVLGVTLLILTAVLYQVSSSQQKADSDILIRKKIVNSEK